ncbi:MAG: Transglutaminase domain-containing protein [Candidatus Magasanikbacteria bacterium GW2011_GWA2_56_11]|uniref:Transglutaminase domain-containing protein n=1 Tax=Candidatus Magasanikbacteria bacterium GW2011_GWA2_56_11 TaxID=1619044 RepID=A0A0G1YGK0_9BACT|nr:MAG: Transglutaminase domain-containing protein [Candidatus Magasanikbacteria bacterium GW2011_GWA2_56_11]
MRRAIISFLALLMVLPTPLSALAQTSTDESQILPPPAESAVVPAGPLMGPESESADTTEPQPGETAAAPAAETAATPGRRRHYPEFMRALSASRRAKTVFSDTERTELKSDFEAFVAAEQERLDKLSVPASRERAYLKRLQKMHGAVDNTQVGRLGSLWQKVREAVGLDADGAVFEEEEPRGYRIPAQPARFSFPFETARVESLRDVTVSHEPSQNTSGLLESLSGRVRIQPVSAEDDDPYLPTLSDVQADDGEITITNEIRDLARALEFNPVKIFNFVRTNIRYEPYFGAKKGSAGCLAEGICNDTDAASLTIALLRAAGIPARYKKSIVVVETARLKELLGVDEVKTVYAAFAGNKVPIFTLGDTPQPEMLDEANLESETHLALEWTFPVAFYDYDERGGNFSNSLSLDELSSTAELQALLGSFPAKQWIPLDILIKPYARTKNEIVADSAGWGAQSFFASYLQYQGGLSPLAKYAADLKTQTGKDIAVAAYQSDRTGATSAFAVLPPSLPYVLGTGETGGTVIAPETWSVLPSARRFEITLTIKRESNNETVLAHTWFASAIANVPVDLVYAGFNAADEAVIASYGGIHATPAELAQLKPAITTQTERYEGGSPLSIGENLVMEFRYSRGGATIHTDEKFSAAGNHEGIYMVVSRVLADTLLDDDSDQDYASRVLLSGNAAIARSYLKRIEESAETIAKSLDYSYATEFARAVITQNRLLNPVNGVPSTFDFEGLTIDAASYINDYSNRGHYKTHRDAFRLLWGLEASYYEGRQFTDLAGLDAISTVIGLQYVSANPGAYTLHTINQANESVIDTLGLSDNTKANLHADVAKGNTIYTPDRPVEKGAFTGILYISLDPNWTGTYAIGEQVGQNGGWTIDDYQVASYQADGWFREFLFKYQPGATDKNRFVYQDMPAATASVLCTLSEATYNAIKSDSGWNDAYGHPCAKETKQFGLVSHTYILATDGAKFFAPEKYNYWVTRDAAQAIVQSQVSKPDGSKFKFNPIAGTYFYGASFAVYYQPTAAGSGAAWKVQDKILAKLSEIHYDPQLYYCAPANAYCVGGKKNWVLDKLGYPTEPQKSGAVSLAGTGGYYQTFIGGQVYVETDWFDEAYYVPGEIAQVFNSPQYELDGEVGTGGTFGWPLGDPKKVAGTLYQDFESGHRISSIGGLQDKAYKIVVEIDYGAGEYQDIFLDGFMDAFREADFYGFAVAFGEGVVINEVVKQVVKKFKGKVVTRVAVRWVPFLGWTIAGLETLAFAQQNKPLYDACQADPYTNPPSPILAGAKPAYYCGKLGAQAVIVALGAASDYVGTKINRLYVTSKAARLGKNKLFAKITDESKGTLVRGAFESNPDTRTSVAQLADRLGDSDLVKLANDPKLVKRLLTDQDFLIFNTASRDLGRYEHIFMGDAAGGWHYYPLGRPGSKITNKVTGKNGVYKGTVEIAVNGQPVEPKLSTFFPDSWTEKDVLTAINQAYNKRVRKPNTPNSFVATVNNVEIEMYIELNTNKIISAFPSNNNF